MNCRGFRWSLWFWNAPNMSQIAPRVKNGVNTGSHSGLELESIPIDSIEHVRSVEICGPELLTPPFDACKALRNPTRRSLSHILDEISRPRRCRGHEVKATIRR